MTEEELTARLRRTMPEYLKGILSSDDVESDLNEAADAIAELRRERDDQTRRAGNFFAETCRLESDNTALKGRVARLEAALRDHVTENVWNAYHIGIEADGRWMDGARSEGEWLASELGLSDGWHDADGIKAALPDLVDRIVSLAALDVKGAG